MCGRRRLKKKGGGYGCDINRAAATIENWKIVVGIHRRWPGQFASTSYCWSRSPILRFY
ncbi:unnamed protein product [Cuscuta europaea]|uniref:Uncharacterized protein n=1 Tax=Cuscuta europaea TaxID=41803 RepID=A0A9P0ZC46_CUSEU|nr:unnamed protein product [Cuscuta europaea]